jgi:outer membrane murein-binding lipoprotein Lpp
MAYSGIMTKDRYDQLATKDFVLEAIENMARMMHAGFQSIESKIGIGMDSIDQRMDILAHAIVNLNERVDNLEKSIFAMHDLFDAIFTELRAIRQEINKIDTREQVADLEIRVSSLEKRIKNSK